MTTCKWIPAEAAEATAQLSHMACFAHELPYRVRLSEATFFPVRRGEVSKQRMVWVCHRGWDRCRGAHNGHLLSIIWMMSDRCTDLAEKRAPNRNRRRLAILHHRCGLPDVPPIVSRHPKAGWSRHSPSHYPPRLATPRLAKVQMPPPGQPGAAHGKHRVSSTGSWQRAHQQAGNQLASRRRRRAVGSSR